MLRLFRSPHGLDLDGLFAVYTQSLRQTATKHYFRLEPEAGLQHTQQDFQRFLQEEFFSRPGDLLALWVVAGQPVSALRLEQYNDGLLLEALETAPEHRRRGYAASLMQAVLEKLPPETMVYAHVDRHNAPSLRTHEACGFRLWKDSAVFVDGTVSTKAITLRYFTPQKTYTCLPGAAMVE